MASITFSEGLVNTAGMGLRRRVKITLQILYSLKVLKMKVVDLGLVWYC